MPRTLKVRGTFAFDTPCVPANLPLRPTGTSPKCDVEAFEIHNVVLSHLGEEGRGPILRRCARDDQQRDRVGWVAGGEARRRKRLVCEMLDGVQVGGAVAVDLGTGRGVNPLNERVLLKAPLVLLMTINVKAESPLRCAA